MNPIANMLGNMMGGNKNGNMMQNMMQGAMQGMMQNMMGGQNGQNPLWLIMQLMSGNMNQQQFAQKAVEAVPQLGPAVQAFQSGNNEQAFSELEKINPQFAQGIKGKSPEQIQQMVGSAIQQFAGQNMQPNQQVQQQTQQAITPQNAG